MILTDLINIILGPSIDDVAALVVDIAWFLFSPALSGYVGATSYVHYSTDSKAYDLAGLSDYDMYTSTMLLFKNGLFLATGRPNFFTNAYLQEQDELEEEADEAAIEDDEDL
eukprot:CAMPEP_0176376980 /NCGR_PEP_ID=MMETSP0126-20121128/28559_1 /TAXON_ID=141414 ORGANISM="Strombidinopsis acuminatum, Strain SPMC142" /NCGR_SAMPLE_ID=MMETSP0126 /ASSEMBLY_ACC=CAM_ASM_000229 /LENGTH=111 /DNA_ID=CAMNT_0017738617 /DNA_START=228 /DNA_END=563 /DNA_ORIENTATION=+